MNLCSLCVMPDTRPDTPFEDGVCAACIAHGERDKIDWEQRADRFAQLLAKFKVGGGINLGRYDCIVPSSGGKDSHYQVLKIRELGYRPLAVTATTCHLSVIGRRNLDNLAFYATTIEVSPNKEVRRKLNRLGLELVGDISWPEHVSIFTVPFQVAVWTGIPLIIYGENPQNQYGGPWHTQESYLLTRRWRAEFGGFLGLRPADVVDQHGISAEDMADYELPSDAQMAGIEAHFLGHYYAWDSYRNARRALDACFQASLPSEHAFWPWENLDNVQTGLHDYFGFLKYGYTRAQAQMSVAIRFGHLPRERALKRLAASRVPPMRYAGVNLQDILTPLELKIDDVIRLANRFADPRLFDVSAAGAWPRFLGEPS